MASRFSVHNVVTAIRRIQEFAAGWERILRRSFVATVGTTIVATPVISYMLVAHQTSAIAVASVTGFAIAGGAGLAFVLLRFHHKYRNDAIMCEAAVASLQILEKRFRGVKPTAKNRAKFAVSCGQILRETQTGVLLPVGQATNGIAPYTAYVQALSQLKDQGNAASGNSGETETEGPSCNEASDG